MVLADMHLKPGEGWEYCPREALRRVSKFLKDEFNLEMNAGFENEFFLLRSVLRGGKEEWVPIHSTVYCSTPAFYIVSPLFREIIAALDSLNISVEQDIPSLTAEVAKEQPNVVDDRIQHCLSHVAGDVDECAVCAGTSKCALLNV